MVNKSSCIEVFNAIIRGAPVSFKEKLFPMFSEFLTENNIKNSEKLINLVVQNPQLIQNSIPEIVDYYSRKYNILSLCKGDKFNNLNPILYYE